ncbi:mRNA-binding ribosome synthesis protein NOC2 [Spizellomyces punctatus DAOM BR117]|uniref:Nucleolar complex protein 2 n=1 Tax=Spizellomyces punctatus (strain DAOM BR117) TaxID=645134 RepID=A0A0L0HIY5_SPIPD|nr:mRNA-binding ribosome synthesis protein NOC2 [Spizellomyces punctatus DAOM BR117]KND00855.1 hypothetical protein SPPG_03959 [Spizellomyces punctatus DAOM BR117]|eukprot:XP_016608894.1 hypothetical protein SPPG_03959 [Spizellomyces punctatus DAOM BR117]
MGKAKKSTKKFVKNHLKDTLARRKKAQQANKYRKKKDDAPTQDVPEEAEVSPEELSSDSDTGGFMDGGLLSSDSEAESGAESDSDMVDDLDDLEELDDEEEESDAGVESEGMDVDDDDDDDDEESRGDGKSSKKSGLKKKLREEITSHKRELEELKEKDPEFFKFLQENDQELLDFVNEEEEVGSDEEGEGDVADTEGMDVGDELDVEDDDGVTVVTKEMIASWRASMVNKYSLRAVRKALLAFRAAAATGDPDEEQTFSYKVENGAVFNNILLLCIKHAPSVFNHHAFGSADGEKQRKGLPSNSSKWKKIQPLVKSFLTNLLRILKSMTDTTVIKFVLRESDGSAPYFACFPKLGKDYVRQLLKFWTSSDEEIRIVSFLCIRRIAIAAPTPYLDMCLKGTYRAYTDQSRNTSIHTWASINFMINCIVELCGVHIATTYQHAFVSIRQLAMHLRTAITTKTKESFKAVYNWQYVHSLRLWSRLLCTYCDKTNPLESVGGNALRPLIYPLVQVSIGVIRLKPSSKFFPLRFHCVRALIEIMRTTGTFIPVASHLFEIFESTELKSRAKPSTQKPLDFTLAIKAPNSYLGTRPYQTGLVEEIVNLLFDFYGAFALSVSFPELAVPAILQLKRYVKKSKNLQINKQLQQLVEKLEQNSKFIQDRRSQVEFSPKDEAKAAAFLSDIDPNLSPLYKHNAARQALKEKEVARLHAEAAAAAAKEDGKVKAAQKRNAKGKPNGRHAGEEDPEDDMVEDFVLSDGDDEEAEEYEMEEEDESEEEG